MARRSLEERIGAWVLLGAKVAVVGFALVGVIYVAQPSLLGAGGDQAVMVGGGGGGGGVDETDAADPTAAQTVRPTSTADDQTAGDVSSDDEVVGLDRERIEELTHREVNERRQDENLAPIQEDDLLVEIARGHSEEMGQQGYFAHESPSGQTFEDRYRLAGYHCEVPVGEDGYLTGGENIYRMTIDGGAVGNGQIAEAAVDSWMNSPEHRRNILRPQWDDMGIGVYILETGTETTIYVTQNFC